MGRNLCVALRRQGSCEVLEFDVHQSAADLPQLAARADVVFHLAGVNRPRNQEEFETGNAGLTQALCSSLVALGRKPVVVLSSSTQAELDNPYGRSKKVAEDLVLGYHRAAGAPVYIYRFPNVFGKWSRPNYNTVVATFCHNISRGLPVQVSHRENRIQFVYIDDIVREFLEIAKGTAQGAMSEGHSAEYSSLPVAPCSLPLSPYCDLQPVYTITLGELHDLLISFRKNRKQSMLPDLSHPLVKYLYSTYVSFYDTQDFAYPVELRTDDRGWLFELIKSPHAGQVFVSRTKPGITRGNHYHDTKAEKFCVVQGEGVIRFLPVLSGGQRAGSQEPGAEGRGQRTEDGGLKSEVRPGGAEVIEYRVSDQDIRIVDIPPGYAHSIENTGNTDMITLFWANEIFAPQQPDTYPMPVMEAKG